MLTNTLMKQLEEDQQGFNSIYMMMHSGARGSREQVRQIGRDARIDGETTKNLAGSVGSIIENPILSNFKKDGRCWSTLFLHTVRERFGGYCVEDSRRQDTLPAAC